MQELYSDQDGWARFDNERAPDIAGEVIYDVLSYVYEVGGEQAVRQAVAAAARQLIEALECEENAEPLLEELARYAGDE